MMGDVLNIINGNGVIVAKYAYDAWGNVISVKDGNSNNITDETNIALVNPIRYRGYYLDRETGFYYLQSRYYDPAIGRFLNADDVEFLGADGTPLSYNLFAYCQSNPINMIDKTGNAAIAIGVFIGVSTIIGGIAGAYTSACTGGNILEGVLEGAVLGAISSTVTIAVPFLLPTTSVAVTTVTTFAIASVGGAIVDYATQRISHELSSDSENDFDLDKDRFFKTALTTGVAGVVPTFGNPANSVLNAVGSLFMGFDASVINSTIEVILSNILKK